MFYNLEVILKSAVQGAASVEEMVDNLTLAELY